MCKPKSMIKSIPEKRRLNQRKKNKTPILLSRSPINSFMVPKKSGHLRRPTFLAALSPTPPWTLRLSSCPSVPRSGSA
jgi:hypothetical protein